MNLYVKQCRRYRAALGDEVLEGAAVCLLEEQRFALINSADGAARAARPLCAGREYEQFACLRLDTRHR